MSAHAARVGARYRRATENGARHGATTRPPRGRVRQWSLPRLADRPATGSIRSRVGRDRACTPDGWRLQPARLRDERGPFRSEGPNPAEEQPVDRRPHVGDGPPSSHRQLGAANACYRRNPPRPVSPVAIRWRWEGLQTDRLLCIFADLGPLPPSSPDFSRRVRQPTTGRPHDIGRRWDHHGLSLSTCLR